MAKKILMTDEEKALAEEIQAAKNEFYRAGKRVTKLKGQTAGPGSKARHRVKRGYVNPMKFHNGGGYTARQGN